MLFKSEVIERLLPAWAGVAAVSTPDGPYTITKIYVQDDLIFLDTFSVGPSIPKEFFLLWLSTLPELQVVVAPPEDDDGTTSGAHYVLDDGDPWRDEDAVVLSCCADGEQDLHLNKWRPENCLDMTKDQVKALAHAVRVRRLSDPDYKP